MSRTTSSLRLKLMRQSEYWFRGGKTQREIAEQLKLDSFGGRDADGVVNLVNPIGDRRLSLMPEGYVRP